jgi:hypothetical protein
MTKTMIKNKVTRWTQALLLALATVLFAASSSYAQTITTTLLNNNGSSVVVFSISNNSATSSYLLTGIGSLAGFTGTGTARLYAKAATYGVAPGAIVGGITAANGWTDIGSNTALVTTANTTTTATGAAATTWISGMSYMIPPLTQIRFCLQHVGSAGAAAFATALGSMRYSTVGTQTCSFTSGDLVLNSCNNYGYGGTMTGPTIGPRGFVGFVNYTSAAPCSGTPTPGNTTGPSAACPGQPFTLGLQNTTSGTGITYLWESADDAAFTLGVTTIGTGNTATASQSTPKYYRCLVDCGGNSAYSNVLNVTMNSFLACYCPAAQTSCSGDGIINVAIPTTTLSSASAGCIGGNNYTYFSPGIASCQLMAGITYTLAVSVQSDPSQWTNAWIDFNQDGLLDASEALSAAAVNPGSSGTTAISFTVPFSAVNGLTRLRIRGGCDISFPNTASCGTNPSTTWGEVEDYDIEITANTACTGTPAPGNTIASAASVCPGAPVTLSLQNLTPGTGVTYQWESADDAAFTLNVQTLGTASNQTANPTTPTYYRCLVDCGGNSAYSTEVLVNINSFLLCYACTPIPTTGADEEIYSVTVGAGSTNPLYAGAAGCTTPAPGPGSILNRYSNFKTLAPITSVMQGDIVPFTVEENECDGATFYAFGTGIWIDYNQDGDFDDVGEEVFKEGSTLIGPRNVTGSFIVPFTALTGTTVMRVIVAESYAGASLTPCLTYGFGETEEFLIDIQPSTACTGTPSPGNTIASAASVCPGSPVSLSLQNQTIGSGVTYQWESADDAAFTLNVQTLGTSPFQTANPTTPTYYRCLVDCGGNSAYSVEVLVGINGFLNCYCSSGLGGSCGINAMSSVEIVTTTLNNVTSGCTGPYNAFPASGSTTATLLAGNPYTMNVGVISGSNTQVAIWIDYNQNGTFETSEYTLINGNIPSGGIGSGSFTIPVTALSGQTGMRVRSDWQGTTAWTSADACTNRIWGETEDYIIDIQLPTPCSGVPAPGNTVASATTFCAPASPITLSLQNPNLGTGITYQWEQADDQAFTIGVVALGTASTQSVTPSQASTWYRCLVDCGGNSAYSTEIQITQNAANQCYCTPVYTSGKIAGDLISNVVISGTTLSNNTGTSPVNPAYTYFPASLGASYTATMTAGNTYNVSVTIGSFSSQGIAVWIDLNANGTFETPSERIGFTSGTIATAFGTGTFPITIPCNPTPGTYRMRVRENYAMSGGLIDPCATYTWGECEDYDVTIAPPLPCPAPSAFALVSGSETPTGASFNWNVGCVETAWNMEFGPTGYTPGTGTIAPVTTNTNAAITTMACGTTYDVYVQADCGGGNGQSLWVGPISVTTANCPCTTPAPGNTIANAATVCPTENLTLSLQNATPGFGVTYQWYSSPDGVNYSPVGTGASTYTTTQAAVTYYYCDVTCATGPSTVSSAPVMVGMNTPTQCYCASAATFAADEEIYSVTVGSGSTDPLYAGSNGCSTVAPGPGSVLSSYSNFTTLGSLTNMTVGSSVPFTVNEDECDGAPYYGFGTAIWIDFNQDGDFNDVGEEVFMESATLAGPRAITGNIAVPLTATTGLTRMRITVAEGIAGTGVLTPCLSYGYGETEDFLVNIVPNNASLLATFMIQGYYDINTGNMQPVYLLSGVGVNPNEADLVTVSLHDASAPYAQVHTFSGVQNINGQISCTFPGSAVGNSYYIVLTNRNSIQTWSANPVLISSSTSYNFTSSAGQAYGSNQIDVSGTGLFAIFNGDVNQDGVVDGLDFNDWETDNNNFAGGYVTTDFNGDGTVDGLDFLIWEPNNNNFVGAQMP